MGLNRGYVRCRSGAEVHATVDRWLRAFYLLRAITSEGMKRSELYRRGRVLARGELYAEMPATKMSDEGRKPQFASKNGKPCQYTGDWKRII